MFSKPGLPTLELFEIHILNGLPASIMTIFFVYEPDDLALLIFSSSVLHFRTTTAAVTRCLGVPLAQFPIYPHIYLMNFGARHSANQLLATLDRS